MTSHSYPIFLIFILYWGIAEWFYEAYKTF